MLARMRTSKARAANQGCGAKAKRRAQNDIIFDGDQDNSQYLRLQQRKSAR
jgi:hypothetical protein